MNIYYSRLVPVKGKSEPRCPTAKSSDAICATRERTAASRNRLPPSIVGLSRTLIAQIELGNRPVSPDELAKLAELYGQSVVDLVGEEAPGNDDLLLMLFDLAPETLSKGARTRVSEILDLCREAASIEEALGRGRKPARLATKSDVHEQRRKRSPKENESRSRSADGWG